MSRINRNNYESYLIDLMEGNLNAQTKDELMAFLDVNPDIKEEFETFDNIVVKSENITLADKSGLKKSVIKQVGVISEENYERMFIAYYEGDLSTSEKGDIEKFIQSNPFLKKDFGIFGSLYLHSDEEVVLANKNSLYHRRSLVPLFWISSVAAAVLLLIAVFGILRYNAEKLLLQDNMRVAQIVPVVDSNSATEIAITKVLVDSSIIDKSYIDKDISVVVKSVIKDKITERKPTQPNVRDCLVLNELPSKWETVGLTDDEVFFRFKYKGIGNGNKGTKQIKKKSFVGKLLTAFFKDTKSRVEPLVPKFTNNEPLLAKVFDGGAHVLNTYTGTEANVTKYYNSQGKLVAYRFSGGQIKFRKQFKP